MSAEKAATRGAWGSRIGFILAAAGSAVGLGNIWKFPYITGENGGGLFVLIYLLCIALVGLPILIAEIMIGRAAQGRPWIFREIDHYLRTGEHMPAPELSEVQSILMEHLVNLHQFYGEPMGARIARKHVSWYLQAHDQEGQFRRVFNALETPNEQIEALEQYFKTLAAN